MRKRLTTIFLASSVIVGCAEEVPAPTAQEYMEDPIKLEAAVVRCAQNRSETRYEAECVNARQAVSILEAKEERIRRDAFEAESERKREALRRTQRAATEARRRAEEAERRRREAEYLAQFGELPPESQPSSEEPSANVPSAVIPDPESPGVPGDVVPQTPPANAPVAVEAPPAEEPVDVPAAEPDPAQPTDLDAVREELRRRSEEADG